MTTTAKKSKFSILELVYIAMFAALMAVCSWISVPTTVPFTMQTFAMYTAVLMLGGKRGFFAILTYLLLGIAGVPVFAGFSSGIGAVLGSTGGYMVGFLLIALIYHAAETLLGDKTWVSIAALILGTVVMYAFGTAWFMFVYMRDNGAISIGTALAWCVWPFIVPGTLKMILSWGISSALKKRISL